MWYYVENGQQSGPVAEAELNALRASGRITDDTLVWAAGMPNWLSLREVKLTAATPEPAPTPAAAPAATPGVIGSSAGYGGSSSGAASPGMVTEDVVRARDYEHDIGGYFNQSMAMFKADMGNILLTTLVVGLCYVIVNGVPYISVITGIILSGPLLGGLFGFFLKKARGEQAGLNDGFGGFSSRFSQLLLGHLVPGIIGALAIIPGLIIFMAAIFVSAAAHHGSSAPSFSGMSIGFMVVGGVLLAIGACVMLYFQYCWIFTLWLIYDKKMTFWPAMQLCRAVVRKHWWQTFALGVVVGLLTMLGLIFCLVGALFTAPIAIGMFAFAYEKLFGDMQPAQE